MIPKHKRKVRSCKDCIHFEEECEERINGFKLFLNAIFCYGYKKVEKRRKA